ncbi:nuclease-related domain-containing protein [Psychrobacillus sp. NPDC058041]|uniref:nuclease-related domain-containing protein n=1 Tax=Psychrobacillus sp. NPDC058041 TaxID=3346310 RepID=UPI0036D99A40
MPSNQLSDTLNPYQWKGAITIEIIRPESHNHHALTRLIARLPKQHEKYPNILEKLDQTNAGYYGELRADRFIEEVQFPQQVHIIPDLHFRLHNKRHIQIDTLILTKSYILITEIKNITGTLQFKEYPNKLVRIVDQEEKPFDCPLIQLDRNCDGISKILTMLNVKIPIHQALVFPSQKTLIENAPKNRNIFFVKQFPLFIQKLNILPPVLTENEFIQLGNKLISVNKNFTPKPLCESLKINSEDLKKGVLCKQCSATLIRKSLRTWLCSACKSIDTNPIPRNIEDLFLLIKLNISIKDCMHYLQINSRYTIYNSLQKMQLEKRGHKRSTKYTRINKPITIK